FLQRPQQAGQLILAMQAAQVLRVGRGDVHRDIVGVLVYALQTEDIVVDSTFNRGVGILTDIQAKHAPVLPELAGLDVLDESVQSIVIEPQSIDQTIFFRKPVHTRLRVAALSPGRYGSDFDKT